jgi:hypothetical protein
MPAPDFSGEARKIVNSYKLSAVEQRQLQKAAAERGITPSEMVREGLRLQGAIPS